MKLSGHEKILGTGLTVSDYWAWAYSILTDNTERGIFAEFLVHTAMKGNDDVRESWKSYDILSPEGIKIEVKSSGYIQAWYQEKLSAVKFSIRPAHSWNPETGMYSDECVRASDVYVFCLQKHTDKSTVNILDLSQWTFFVIPTQILDVETGMQKTITLNRLKTLGAVEVNYDDLRDTVIKTAGSVKQ